MNRRKPQQPPDSRVWSHLAERLLALAERVVRRRGVQGFDAEDLALEAVAESWRYLSQRGIPDLPEEELQRLVATVAERRAADLLRRRNRESGMPLSGEPSSADQNPDPLMIDKLERALGLLTPFERQVVELHIVHGLTYEEIAIMTGRATDVVRSVAARATRMLRSSLPDEPAH